MNSQIRLTGILLYLLGTFFVIQVECFQGRADV